MSREVTLLGWQKDVLRWALDPTAPAFGAIYGGIGCGKTYLLSLVAEVVAVTRPGSLSLLVSDTHGRLMGNNQRECIKLFPSEAEFNGNDKVWRFPTAGGVSELELKYYKLHSTMDEAQNPLEGRTVTGIFIVDEAQTLPMKVLEHAADRSRGQSIDLNGVTHHTKILLNGRPGAIDWWVKAVEELGGRVWRPMTADNPHNGPHYIANIYATRERRVADCLTKGTPMPVEGAIYDCLRDETWPAGNLVEGWRYDHGAPVELGIDFGRRTPAVVWIQPCVIDGLEVDVIFDAWGDNEKLTRDIVAAIRDPWHRRWSDRDELYGVRRGQVLDLHPDFDGVWRVDVAATDPAGNAKDAKSGKTDIDLLRRRPGQDPDGLGGGLGCRVAFTTNADRVPVHAGITRLQGLMDPGLGHRRLLITRELWERGMSAPAGARTLARSLLTYSWEHADRKSRSGRDHDSTHHCDALRYWCINRRWGPTSKAPPGLAFGLGIGRDSAGLPSN